MTLFRSSGPNALGVFTLVHSLLLSDFDVMMYVPESFMHREHIEYAFVLKVGRFCQMLSTLTVLRLL